MKYILIIREVDSNIFDAVKSGVKRVETRAATPKYSDIKSGDTLVFKCGSSSVEKKVKLVKIYEDIKDLVKDHSPSEINPEIGTLDQLEKMYYSFPNYREKIKEYGIIAMNLSE